MADYGLVVFASNGSTQVFSPSSRYSNVIAAGTVNVPAFNTSSGQPGRATVSCSGANDTANVAISIQGGTSNATAAAGSVANRTSSGFEIVSYYTSAINFSYVAVRTG